MQTSSLTDCVVIRSRDRDTKSTSTSSFRLSFQRPLSGRYIMVYCLIPATVYPVTGSNNIIYFRENSTNKLCTIPAGNYTGSGLATAVASTMTTASGGYATFSASFDTSTYLITISSTQSFVLQWGTFTTSSAAALLGYPASDTFAGTSAAGTYMIDLAAPISLNIRISPGTVDSSFVTASLVPSGLVVPLTTDFGVYSAITSSDLPQTITFSSPAKTLDVEVLDSSGTAASLNGANWEMYLRRWGAFPEIAQRSC